MKINSIEEIEKIVDKLIVLRLKSNRKLTGRILGILTDIHLIKFQTRKQIGFINFNQIDEIIVIDGEFTEGDNDDKE